MKKIVALLALVACVSFTANAETFKKKKKKKAESSCSKEGNEEKSCCSKK